MLALSFQKSQNINIVIYYSYNLLVLSSGAHEECLLLQKSCQSDAILYSQYSLDDFPMEDLHTCRTWKKFSKVIYNLNNANVKVFQAFRSWGQRTEMWAEKFFPPWLRAAVIFLNGWRTLVHLRQINHASNELWHPSCNCGRWGEPAILFSRLLLRVLDTCVASFFGLQLRMNGMHIYHAKKRWWKSVLTFDRSCPHSVIFRNTGQYYFSETLMFNILSKNPPGITGMIMWSMKIFQLLPLMIKRNV